MAINNQTREIEINSCYVIEAYTGKKVRSWMHCHGKFTTEILFEDGTVGELGGHDTIENITFIKNHNFCISCGENHSAGYYDYAGRCFNTLQKMWGSARKVFWHRYIKNGHKIPYECTNVRKNKK